MASKPAEAAGPAPLNAGPPGAPPRKGHIGDVTYERPGALCSKKAKRLLRPNGADSEGYRAEGLAAIGVEDLARHELGPRIGEEGDRMCDLG